MSYRSDIDSLIGSIDKEIWADKTINGIQYDVYPWHGYTAISIQTRLDDEYDVASWKYFECAKTDGESLKAEFEKYQENYDRHLYHRMLVEAAKNLLETDLSEFGIETMVSDIGLNKLFQPRVFDPDNTLSFNYCEFVVASEI